jgi:diadenylate cyclase
MVYLDDWETRFTPEHTRHRRALGRTELDFISAWLRDLANAGWTTLLATVVDVLLVSAAIYWLIMLSKRTRAWLIIWGLLIFLALVRITDWLQLHTINYLLGSFLPLLPVAIVLLFYPELRHTLENMGKVADWSSGLDLAPKEDLSHLVHVVVRSACRMSERRIGALMVLERTHKLDDVAATGTRLGAAVSEELMMSVFNPGGPLHDGAVIIRGTRILAAGCTLPLSESTHVGTMIHTRHKAALGVAEETDAAVVVVSEETGTISLALEGKLYRELTEETLTQWLRNVTGISEEGRKPEIVRKVDGTLRKAKFLRK